MMLFMIINNIEVFPRTLNLKQIKESAFLFGPRMTGKTSLLEQLKADLFIDLLNPENELQYIAKPALLWDQLSALPRGAFVIIDEVQRAPKLLDFVQMGIQKLKQRFFLSGSSARKIRRGSGNLLGGRALDLRLHALSRDELGVAFNINHVLRYGSLPKIALEWHTGELSHAEDLLSSYVTTYLKEEIQAEALVRHLDSFQRFLAVAAQSNAQMIEYTNISNDCSVHMNTVKGYFEILEDTLLGFMLWPLDRSERKKARPKFYFFDCGVVRALQGLADSKPSPSDLGFLFETWFINEVRRINDYQKKRWDLNVWREAKWELDLVVSKGSRPQMAIEIKSSRVDHLHAAHAFKRIFPKTPLVIASLVDTIPRKLDGLEVLPFETVLKHLRTL